MKKSIMLIIFTLFMISLISSAFAAELYTTDIDNNPKDDYSPGEIVYIHGNGFTSDTNVLIGVTRPNAIVETGSIVSDSFGSFVYLYNIGDINVYGYEGTVGTYNVLANDGTNSAEVSFTDADMKIDYPTGGSTVSGVINILWHFADNPIYGPFNYAVRYKQGGPCGSGDITTWNLIGTQSCGTVDCSMSWDTTVLSDGSFCVGVEKTSGNYKQDRTGSTVTVNNVPCSSYSTSGTCNADPSCDWCPSCSATKYSGNVDRCVDAGNCNYACEIDPISYCGATCDSDDDCPNACDGIKTRLGKCENDCSCGTYSSSSCIKDSCGATCAQDSDCGTGEKCLNCQCYACTTLLSDGFEGADWDANWDDNYVTSWLQDNSYKHSGTYSAKASDGNEGYLISDNLDTTSADFVLVNFWLRKHNTDSTDATLYYYDGSNYDNIAELDDLGGDDTFLHYINVIIDNQYFISNFRVGFDATLDSGETLRIDDVLIMKCSVHQLKSAVII